MTKIRLERTYDATLAELWELWTTREGIESWWGPDGFRVEVRHLDVRPSGTMAYAMIAVGAEQIAFMKQHGAPTTTEHAITYTDVVPERRLGWRARVDFTEAPAYDVDNVMQMEATPGGVHLTLEFDAMHSEVWNGRMVAGWEMELDKLARLVAR